MQDSLYCCFALFSAPDQDRHGWYRHDQASGDPGTDRPGHPNMERLCSNEHSLEGGRYARYRHRIGLSGLIFTT